MTSLLRSSLVLLILLATFAAPSFAQLNYQVDLKDSAQRYVYVTLSFQAQQDQPELMMAVWTPGSYLVREYARHIDSMQVSDGKGNDLPYRKTRKNRWLVKSKKGATVKVSYRLYCNERSVRTNFVNHDYAVLNGAPTFITIPDRLEQPHTVSLKLAPDWKRSATSLPVGEGPHQYVADNFDQLVDSPIVAGNLQVYPFEAGGVSHQLVNVGEQGLWDGSKAAADLKKIVIAQQTLWKSVPYDRYLFLNVICGGGGGLEHDHSTLVLSDRFAFRNQTRYQKWLSLCSHEFYHTWNVRRLRPKSLLKYDYENEIYTDGLWIAEGITSYYQILSLVRAGLMSEKEFIAELNSDIVSVQRSDGRKFQSLRDSSFDTWIKFYRPDENSANTRISYYAKGAVVAFLLDMKIRSLTDNAKSLDDVMRTMLERFSESGYTSKDFRSVASEVAGDELDDWFANAIDSTDELSYDDSLTFMGIATPAAIEPAGKRNARTGKAVSIGADFTGATVSKVSANSPAWKLGLAVDDEVIAVNDFRVEGSVAEIFQQYQIGDRVELLINRRGKLLSEKFVLEKKVSQDWSIRWLSKMSRKQRQRVEAWLRSPSKGKLSTNRSSERDTGGTKESGKPEKTDREVDEKDKGKPLAPKPKQKKRRVWKKPLKA